MTVIEFPLDRPASRQGWQLCKCCWAHVPFLQLIHWLPQQLLMKLHQTLKLRTTLALLVKIWWKTRVLWIYTQVLLHVCLLECVSLLNLFDEYRVQSVIESTQLHLETMNHTELSFNGSFERRGRWDQQSECSIQKFKQSSCASEVKCNHNLLVSWITKLG